MDYITREDAKTAHKALINTHLYGRHLVIEWAKMDDTSVEALREKTANQFKSSKQHEAQQQMRKKQRVYKDEYDLDSSSNSRSVDDIDASGGGDGDDDDE